jgi:hypothetical protein
MSRRDGFTIPRRYFFSGRSSRRPSILAPRGLACLNMRRKLGLVADKPHAPHPSEWASPSGVPGVWCHCGELTT